MRGVTQEKIMYRKNKGTLLAYYGQTGAIHFNWVNEQGVATGRKVRRYEINDYLRTEDGKYRLEKGYKVAWNGDVWVMIPDILKLEADNFRHKVLFKSEIYEIYQDEVICNNRPVINWSILSSLSFYINNSHLYEEVLV
jgi:hypothetical protein